MAIMIIDCNVKRQQQLRSILSSLGRRSADIDSRRELKAGVATLRKKRYDTCFIAAHPSQTDIFAAITELRRGALSSALPVVVFSGQATREYVAAAVHAGATYFLAYPFTVDNVEAALRASVTDVRRSAPKPTPSPPGG